jgi:preprotein translocase subunit Sec63
MHCLSILTDFNELDSLVIAKMMFLTKIWDYKIQEKDCQWQSIHQYHQKHLNMTVTLKVVLFAITNELHGVCHTTVRIQAVFLLPLEVVMAGVPALTTT